MMHPTYHTNRKSDANDRLTVFNMCDAFDLSHFPFDSFSIGCQIEDFIRMVSTSGLFSIVSLHTITICMPHSRTAHLYIQSMWLAHMARTPYTIHSPSPIPERSRPKMKCCSYQKQIWKLVNCIGVECSLARAISIITHAPHRRNICTVNFNLYKHRFD